MYKFALFFILFMSGLAGFVLLRIFWGMAPVITVAGICVVFFAFKDYDWFMNHYKTAPFRAVLGRDGTRILYMLFGIVIFIMGLMSF